MAEYQAEEDEVLFEGLRSFEDERQSLGAKPMKLSDRSFWPGTHVKRREVKAADDVA